jgi:uncharacterized protein (DUF1697 family)
MVLVAFLRGVNVGGHRTFRPRLLAESLRAQDVVSIGAAGTFVARRPGSRRRLRAALEARLPFAAEIAMCDGRDLLELAADEPFAGQPSGPDVVRFVGVLARKGRARPDLPIALPPDCGWLLRVIAARDRFVLGLYRRDMRTIRQLGRLDELFGAPVAIRNWNTIMAIARLLIGESQSRGSNR